MSKKIKKANSPFGFGFDSGFMSKEDESLQRNSVTSGLLTLKENLSNLVQWSLHAALATDLDPMREECEDIFRWHAKHIVRLEHNLVEGILPLPNLPDPQHSHRLAMAVSVLCGQAEVIGEDVTIQGKTELTSERSASMSGLMGEVSLNVLVSPSRIGWLTNIPNTDSILDCPTITQYQGDARVNMYATVVEQMVKICREDFEKEWRTLGNYIRASAF